MHPDPLLKTKLYIPRERQALVPRPGLIARLNTGLHRKLTLVSAPAGFGKSTLLSDWIRHDKLPTDWVSLDENDNSPRRFLSYLIAALQTIHPGVAQEVLTWLRSSELSTRSQSEPNGAEFQETALTGLANDIAAITGRFILILDDYHAIQSLQIHDALGFLLDYLPPQMHLVIASRSDPPLPDAWAVAQVKGSQPCTQLRCRIRDSISHVSAGTVVEIGSGHFAYTRPSRIG